MNEKERLRQIAERLAAINTEIDAAESEDALNALNSEADDLINERNAITERIQSRQQIRNKVASGAIGTIVGIDNQIDEKKHEERAKAFMASKRTSIATTQLRAALVSSGKLATPTAVSGINDTVGANLPAHACVVYRAKVVDR